MADSRVCARTVPVVSSKVEVVRQWGFCDCPSTELDPLPVPTVSGVIVAADAPSLAPSTLSFRALESSTVAGEPDATESALLNVQSALDHGDVVIVGDCALLLCIVALVVIGWRRSVAWASVHVTPRPLNKQSKPTAPRSSVSAAAAWAPE